MKEFFGKAVLSMAAQGGLLHGAVQQTEKNFFQRRAGRENRQAETVYLQWVQSFAAQGGRFRMAAACWGGQIAVAKQMKLC